MTLRHAIKFLFCQAQPGVVHAQATVHVLVPKNRGVNGGVRSECMQYEKATVCGGCCWSTYNVALLE